MIDDIRKSPLPVSKKPVLDGKEIMQILNVKPGPLVGDVSRFLIELEEDYAAKGKALKKDEAKKQVLERYSR